MYSINMNILSQRHLRRPTLDYIYIFIVYIEIADILIPCTHQRPQGSPVRSIVVVVMRAAPHVAGPAIW